MNMRALGLAGLALAMVACGDARAALSQAHALWDQTLASAPQDALPPSTVDALDAPPAGDLRPPLATWIGVVVARDVVDLAAPADGVVTTLAARRGARVRAGDRIASLDDTAPAAEWAAADAAVRRARAELRQAELAVETAALQRDEERGLAAAGASARSARARAEIDHRAALAARARARAAVAEAEAVRELRAAVVSSREVLAPFDGTVELERTAAGAFVQRGATVVRLLGDARVVRFFVPLSDAVPPPGSLLELVDPAGGASGCARVEHVAREADAGAQQLAVEAALVGAIVQPPSGQRVLVRPQAFDRAAGSSVLACKAAASPP